MDSALNNLRTLARQFIQFSVALVCARDVGRVLVSGKSERMAVEDDVNVFRKTLDDLIDLGKRGSAFKERSRQSRTREDSLKRPADPEILSMIVAEPNRERAAASRKTVARSAAGSWANRSIRELA